MKIIDVFCFLRFFFTRSNIIYIKKMIRWKIWIVIKLNFFINL